MSSSRLSKEQQRFGGSKTSIDVVQATVLRDVTCGQWIGCGKKLAAKLVQGKSLMREAPLRDSLTLRSRLDKFKINVRDELIRTCAFTVGYRA